MDYNFDVGKFRHRFPEFKDTESYPEDRLILFFCQSGTLVNHTDSRLLSGDKKEEAIFLAVAHIATIQGTANTTEKEPNHIVSSASVGGVSIGIQPPPYGTSQFTWWLNTTVYGQWLLVILGNAVARGFYIGGSQERRSFRKEGGEF